MSGDPDPIQDAWDQWLQNWGGNRVALKRMRAMFVGQGASGLAEDRIVNNFMFVHKTESGPLEADDFTEVRAAVSAFYEQSGPSTGVDAQTNPIGKYISPWVNRAAELRLYDENQTKPRVPIISAITLGTPLDSNGYPEEVAVCLSFRTDLPNTARRRGRIYIGPLCAYAGGITESNQSGPAHVAQQFMTDLLKAANRLSEMSVNMRWCTWSSFDSDSTLHPVKFAWVDDAVDTQRRRGSKSGARSTLDLALPA